MSPVDIRHATSPSEIPTMDTDALRERFLVADLFKPGDVTLTYSHHDRVVLVGAMPTDAPLDLVAPPELRAEHFLERREIGFVNVGDAGTITVDGTVHELDHGACLYVGRGSEQVSLASAQASSPARFYGFSAPAHTAYPTTLVRPGEGTVRELGDQATSNRRTINQYIHADGVRSAQVVMGVTTLHEGSMWNTMPAHTHDRRMEAYLYFDVPEEARVLHLMGEPTQTRHIVIANEQAVISPSWSIHSGVGTSAYSFVWAMAGENQAFDDMDHVQVTEIR